MSTGWATDYPSRSGIADTILNVFFWKAHKRDVQFMRSGRRNAAGSLFGTISGNTGIKPSKSAQG